MNRVIYAIDQLSKTVGHAFAWSIVILMLGTANLRLAALREQRKSGRRQ